MNIYIDKQPNMINFNDAFFNSYAIPFVKADNNIGATIRNSISKIEDCEFPALLTLLAFLIRIFC